MARSNYRIESTKRAQNLVQRVPLRDVTEEVTADRSEGRSRLMRSRLVLWCKSSKTAMLPHHRADGRSPGRCHHKARCSGQFVRRGAPGNFTLFVECHRNKKLSSVLFSLFSRKAEMELRTIDVNPSMPQTPYCRGKIFSAANRLAACIGAFSAQ